MTLLSKANLNVFEELLFQIEFFKKDIVMGSNLASYLCEQLQNERPINTVSVVFLFVVLIDFEFRVIFSRII